MKTVIKELKNLKNKTVMLHGIENINDIMGNEIGNNISKIFELIDELNINTNNQKCNHLSEPILDKDGYEVCPDCGMWGENC